MTTTQMRTSPPPLLAPRMVCPPPEIPLSRPCLRGGTLLLVEDSRLCCEAIRLMFRGAGGRLRRAETLAAARRDLSLYTPDAVIVDLGLPDGSGLDLISEIDRKSPRVPLIIAISGQPDLDAPARKAGADRFLAKPFDSIRRFRQVLAPVFFKFPQSRDSDTSPTPDAPALRDDLYLALDLLSDRHPEQRAYALQFITTLARSLSDTALLAAVHVARDSGAVDDLATRIRIHLRGLPLI